LSIAVGATTAQTPATKNYGALKRYVASWVHGANLPRVLTDAGIAINATIDMLNMETWMFLRKTHSITPTADDDTFDIPQDFDKPNALILLDSNGRPRRRIGYLDPKNFEDEFTYSPSSTHPTAYTVHNPSDELVLTMNHKVSQGFIDQYPTWRLRYFARLLHLAGNSETMADIGATAEVWTILGWGGRMELAGIRGGDVQTCERMLYGSPGGRNIGLLNKLRRKEATPFTDLDDAHVAT